MPFLHDLLSHLPIHPHHSPPTASSTHPTDLIWLLDNTAYVSPSTRRWTADYVAAYFVRNTGEDVSAAVAELSHRLGLARDEATEALVRARVQPFFNLIAKGRTCEITHGDAVVKAGAPQGQGDRFEEQGMEEVAPGEHTSDSSVELGPSNSSGISTNTLSVSGAGHYDGNVMTCTAALGDSGTCVPCRTTFAREKGWAVISDIDDTIKRTLTPSATGILKTTFAEEPVPIAGMPEFYRHMVGVLLNPPFWYLSASPYNLYQFLHEFRDRHYPAGTIILREASWMSLAGFVSSLRQGTKEYKVGEMVKLHERFPGRRMVCLGDSTQSDPEAYATVYKQFPGWVKGIFIRKVLDVTEVTDEFTPGDDEKKRNSEERFRKAFEGVPEEVYHVFEKPEELYKKLDEIVARG